jgi:hypothetical protein
MQGSGSLPPLSDPYCSMSGHSQRGCPGPGTPEHNELCRQGLGFSRVPGPNESELLEEIRADRELMRDEMHGRDPDPGRK